MEKCNCIPRLEADTGIKFEDFLCAPHYADCIELPEALKKLEHGE